MSLPAARWVGLTLGLLLCCVYTIHLMSKGASGATLLESFGYLAVITPPVCSHPPALSECQLPLLRLHYGCFAWRRLIFSAACCGSLPLLPDSSQTLLQMLCVMPIMHATYLLMVGT